MEYRYDNSVESSNTPFSKKVRDYGLYRCMVIGVDYIDSANNFSGTGKNPQVLYEVMVLGGFKEGQLITGVRLASSMGGGQYNYYERVLKKASKKTSTPLHEQDGDIVYLQFLQGNVDAPTIIAMGVNCQDSTQTGATKALGPIERKQYNGIYQYTNKDGEFLLTRKGGSYNATTDQFIPIETGTFESRLVLEDDNIIIEDASNGITINKSGNLITLSTKSGKTKITINGTTDKVVVNAEHIELGDATLEYIVKSKMLKDWIKNEIDSVYNGHTHPVPAVVPLALAAVAVTPLIPPPPVSLSIAAPNEKMTDPSEADLASLKHKVE